MPAQAGIQVDFGSIAKGWIPAYAGMTKGRVDFQSRNSEALGLEPRIIPFLVCEETCAIYELNDYHSDGE